MSPTITTYRPWLHRYALLLVVATFVLIGIGGNVTSKGAGLAVPDWPQTFGHNMLTAPPSVWYHNAGTFWEHSHRLKGSVVGLLTIGLTVWLWVTQKPRPWLRLLGVGLLLLVIAQGIMGGLRVTEMSLWLAGVHGVVGQVFLCLVVTAAAATSRTWLALAAQRPGRLGFALTRLRALAVVVLGALVLQLVLGAAVRHSGAGLAIPDFPTSYGQVLPPMNPEALDAAIASLPPELASRDYTIDQVAIHFTHRAWAMVVLTLGLWLIAELLWQAPGRGEVVAPTITVFGLLLVQVALGVLVIWSGRYPEVATAHQAVGAALIASVTWLLLRVFLVTRPGGGQRREAKQTRVPAAPASLQGTPA